jgi:Type I phosphodiesterase / nucleotide pyrophosphatase
MEMHRRLCSLTLASLLIALPAVPARASAYDGKPKLVVLVVIDQFREDYLERYRADLKAQHGFRLFLDYGAYFPDCYYDYANTKTAPGHATLGTGAYTDGHGINSNQWWDLSRNTKHAVSSVEDERYEIVGDHGPEDIGTSPRSELASTLGDEVALATKGKSKVFGVSLKDRAAILTSGHASNGAFWLDHASGHFVSSTYWGPKLPDWVQQFNSGGRTEQAVKESHARPDHFYDDAGATPASVSYLLDFAQALITAEKLGQNETTDVLTISISSTDILGHKVGPDAPEQRAMIDAIDVDLNAFFIWLDKHVDGGMANVWVSLTGDHGIGPALPAAAAARMPAAQFDMNKVLASLDATLNERYSPGQNLKYMLPNVQPAVTLDPRPFTAAKVSEAEAEQAVADLLPGAFASSEPPAAEGAVRLPTRAAIRETYTKSQIGAGQVPATEAGRRVLNSYSPYGGWYVLYAVGMYEQGAPTGTNHFTPYSYDRHVPLAFFGAPFVVGTYHQPVEPVDIAVTFSSLLRVNRPSAAVGHVLTFALKPQQ